MLTTEDTESTEAATPETDAAVTTFTSISKLKKRFECSTGKVSAEFARRLERERDEAIRQRDETNESSVFSCNFYYEEKLKAERERDEARDAIRALAEHGESEIQRITKERDEAREALRTAVQERHDFHWELLDAVRERDEARELAQQMSDSNQVLMADVRFYRNAWEQLKEVAK